MHKGDAFAGEDRGDFGEHDVIVDQGRTVAYLDEDVIGEHGAHRMGRAFRRLVVAILINGGITIQCIKRFDSSGPNPPLV